MEGRLSQDLKAHNGMTDRAFLIAMFVVLGLLLLFLVASPKQKTRMRAG